MGRFQNPLTSDVKAGFPATAGMIGCLDEMAGVRGISRSELLRRIVAAAIVTDSPRQLGQLGKQRRAEIEQLGGLGLN